MAIYGGPDIINDGLVFHMDFASSKCYPGTGSSCFDLSGTNISTGEIINGPVFNTSVNNKHFTFNGGVNAQLIRIPNSTNLNTQTPSVEVWIKTNAILQTGGLFEKGDVNSQYSLLQDNSILRWRQMIPGFNDVAVLTSSFMNINSWYQIVGTFVSGSQRLYINGAQVATGTATGTISTSNVGMSIGVLGGYSGSRTYYYNGNIAIVKVYNKVLSQSEVVQNYNALKGRFGL
jgi:hypothetical protein